MHKLRLLAANLGYLLLGASVAVTAAQPNTCAPLVAQALAAVDSNCTELGRNSVCYGYDRVDATFFEAVEDTFFSTPADRAELAQLASIQTAPLDVENNQWGVAMMNVQANVPNSLPGQAVTFVLLGDARVENAVAPESAFLVGDPVRVVVTAAQTINVRSGPGTTFNVVANAGPGQLFDVDARNEVGDWFRISGPAPYQWVNRSLIAVQTGAASALTDLPVAPESPKSPMQAFYFRTGIGAPQCSEAPDMLVVQGPKQVRVSLTVNGAEVGLGSTIAFQSGETTLGELRAEARMQPLLDDVQLGDGSVCLFTEMSVLEGDALANDGALFVPLGHWAKSATCLDENRSPVLFTPFGEPRLMDEEEIGQFAPLEDVPFPHYALELPTREEIQESIDNGPDQKPEPTPLGVVQVARPTARPTQPGSDNNTTPRPTETPSDQTQPDPNAPSCDGFGIIGPGDVIDAYGQLFAWNFARNVAGYQLEIVGIYRGSVAGVSKLYRVGSESNGITVQTAFDLSSSITDIDWKVQVLVRDGQGNLVTLCESGYRRSAVDYSSG